LLVAALWTLWRRRKLALAKQRAEIAADLHDEMGSELASLQLLATELGVQMGPNSEAIDELRETTQALRENLKSIVSTLKGQQALSVQHLAAELRAFARRLWPERAELTAETVFSLTLAPDVAGLKLAPHLHRQLYLICVEALNNARRHANAQRVLVEFRLQAGTLLLRIEDNGAGFDPAAVRNAGNGLSNLQMRADKLGAVLRMHSKLGQGSAMELSVPIGAPSWH
jgi:two-component system, NarL family, sensor histidine kinase UhpB